MHINGYNNKIEFHTSIFIHEDENMRDIKDWKERLLTIIQQIPEKADTLKPIIQFLVTTISPSKIYMLDHRSIVGHPMPAYIDMLLVISNKNNIPFAELEPIFEIPYLKESRVVCSLHNEGVVLQALESGHIFYSLNFTAENLIYDDKAINYPELSQQRIQEIKQQARNPIL